MADSSRRYLFVYQYILSTKLIWRCLQIQLGVICSVSVWTLSEAKLQAAQAHQIWKSPLELTERVTKVNSESVKQYSKLRTHRDAKAGTWSDSTALGSSRVSGELNFGEFSMPLPYRLEPKPILIAAPENFNPDLRLPPALPEPPPNPSPPTTSTEPKTPDAVLESIYTDYSGVQFSEIQKLC